MATLTDCTVMPGHRSAAGNSGVAHDSRRHGSAVRREVAEAVKKVRRAGDLTLDTTSIWKAFVDPEAVVRGVDDAQIANAMKRKGLDIAVAQGRDGWIIVAERDPIRLKRWLDAAHQQKAWLVSEPMDELRRRARARGPECEELLVGWDDYEDDPELAALTEPWSEDDMRTLHEVEIQYRSALEGVTVREAGCDVQHRCLTDKAELRAEGGNSRVVTGVAVRYGDEARLGGFRERIKRGALELPSASGQPDDAARPRHAARHPRMAG